MIQIDRIIHAKQSLKKNTRNISFIIASSFITHTHKKCKNSKVSNVSVKESYEINEIESYQINVISPSNLSTLFEYI